MRIVVLACVSILAATAVASEQPSWAAFEKANRYKCPGPFDTIKAGRAVTLGNKTYKHSGYKLEVQNPDADSAIVIGVLSAIKNASPETRKNLASAFATFKSRGVEWVVVNGDLSLDEEQLDEVFEVLGGSGFPVLAVIGNAESKGSFSRAFTEAEKKHPNLVNGVWVRQIVGDDVEMWTMPGYYDAAFVRQGAGCPYTKADVDALAATTASGKAPVVLISHGPPAGSGAAAIDYMTSAKNVGDAQLTDLIHAKGIHFGFFGHILEAGGAAVGADMKTHVSPGVDVADLFVNAGSASADAEHLNNGKTGHGLAMIITMSGGKARYETLELEAIQ